MRLNARFAPVCVLLLLIAGQTVRPVRAEEHVIEAPDDREFVLDFADIVTKDDTAKISQTGKKLLTDTGVRLVILTVKTMAQYNDADNIQAFSRKVLDHWIAKQTDKMWTKAVMIVRAKDDKKFRIQLGGAWKHSQDDAVDKIITDIVTPRFKANEVSKGLLETTNALDKLLRKNISKANVEAEPPPSPPADKK